MWRERANPASDDGFARVCSLERLKSGSGKAGSSVPRTPLVLQESAPRCRKGLLGTRHVRSYEISYFSKNKSHKMYITSLVRLLSI